MTRESNADGLEYLLDLHLSKIGYDNGYWVTMRIVEIAPDSGRPFGVQYSLTLHDGKDDRVLGFDNSHSMDIATAYLSPCLRRSDEKRSSFKGVAAMAQALGSATQLIDSIRFSFARRIKGDRHGR